MGVQVFRFASTRSNVESVFVPVRQGVTELMSINDLDLSAWHNMRLGEDELMRSVGQPAQRDCGHQDETLIRSKFRRRVKTAAVNLTHMSDALWCNSSTKGLDASSQRSCAAFRCRRLLSGSRLVSGGQIGQCAARIGKWRQ